MPSSGTSALGVCLDVQIPIEDGALHPAVCVLKALPRLAFLPRGALLCRWRRFGIVLRASDAQKDGAVEKGVISSQFQPLSAR